MTVSNANGRRKKNICIPVFVCKRKEEFIRIEFIRNGSPISFDLVECLSGMNWNYVRT